MAVSGAGGVACVFQLHLEPDNGIVNGGLGGVSGGAVGRKAELCLEFLNGFLGLAAELAVGGTIEKAKAHEILLQVLDLGAAGALLHGCSLGPHGTQQRQHRHKGQHKRKNSGQSFLHNYVSSSF